jgi:hypothetical protein
MFLFRGGIPDVQRCERAGHAGQCAALISGSAEKSRNQLTHKRDQVVFYNNFLQQQLEKL